MIPPAVCEAGSGNSHVIRNVGFPDATAERSSATSLHGINRFGGVGDIMVISTNIGRIAPILGSFCEALAAWCAWSFSRPDQHPNFQVEAGSFAGERFCRCRPEAGTHAVRTRRARTGAPSPNGK